MQQQLPLIIVAFAVGLSENILYAQIPYEEPDFRFLANVRWGMSLVETQSALSGYHTETSFKPIPESLKKEMREKARDSSSLRQPTSDTVLVFSDTLFRATLKIILKFSEDTHRLVEIDVNADDPDKTYISDMIQYLKKKHGEPASTKKQEKTILFWSFTIEFNLWKLERDRLTLSVTSRGDSPVGATVVYAPPRETHP